MRLVIDTNILVSHLFWPNSPLRPLVKKMLRDHEVLRSTESFAELAEVVMRPKFDPYLSSAEREVFLGYFYDTSHYVQVAQRIHACRDHRDNKFLELAVSGKAKLLVSGDADLLALHPFRGITIAAPHALSL